MEEDKVNNWDKSDSDDDYAISSHTKARLQRAKKTKKIDHWNVSCCILIIMYIMISI